MRRGPVSHAAALLIGILLGAGLVLLGGRHTAPGTLAPTRPPATAPAAPTATR